MQLLFTLFMLLQQIVSYSMVTGLRLRLQTVLLVLKYCLSTYVWFCHIMLDRLQPV